MINLADWVWISADDGNWLAIVGPIYVIHDTQSPSAAVRHYFALPELCHRLPSILVEPAVVLTDLTQCGTVLGVSALTILVGLLLNNPVKGVLLRRCILFVFLFLLVSLDTGVKSSIILIHACGFRATIV